MGIQQGQGFGALAGGTAANLLTGGAKALFGHVTDAIEQGIRLRDLIEQQKIGFTSLLGSQQAAVAHMKEVFQFGALTPFRTPELLDYSQKLQAVGMTARDVIPFLTDLGDAMSKAGSFDRMDKAILAITQMRSKNKLTAEEWTGQLSEALPGATAIAARGLNVSQSDFMEAMTEGRIKLEPFLKLLALEMRKEAGGSMEKIGLGTLEGLESTLEDNKMMLWANGVSGGDAFGDPAGAYKARMDKVKGLIQLYSGPQSKKIADTLGTNAEWYYKIQGVIEENAFQSDWFTDLLHGDPEGAKAKLKSLGNFIPQGLADGLSSGGALIGDAAKKLGDIIYAGFDSLWQFGSPSKKAMQMGAWIREGMELGLTKGQAKNYANLEALTKADPDFLKTLGVEAAKRGVNPDDMLNLIAVESGFNKSVMNRFGYGGLGQVGRDERADLGFHMSDAAFKKLLEDMPASWQLDHLIFPLLDKKIKENPGMLADGRISLDEMYAAWGSGHATGDPNAIHMAKGGMRARAYANNPLWDFNHDGVVRESEFGRAALAALGAGKFFSVNGAPVTKSNPVPVSVIDFGNGVDFRSGPSFYDQKDPAYDRQIAASRGMYAARRGRMRWSAPSLVDVAPEMISDNVPINVDVLLGKLDEPLETLGVAVDASALQFKKLTGVTQDVANAEQLRLTRIADGSAELDAEIAKLRGEVFGPGSGAKKRDKLFGKELTRLGAAGDFQGAFQDALMNPFKGSSWGNFGTGLLRDIQGRAAHDLSSSLTEMIFGGRDKDGNLFGGLWDRLLGRTWSNFDPGWPGAPGKSKGGLSGLLSGLFGSLFGGHRASGGPVEPGRFYRWQEPGTGGEWLFAGDHGHIMNRSQMQRAFNGGGARAERIFLVDDVRAAQEHFNASDANYIYRVRRNMKNVARFDRYR